MTTVNIKLGGSGDNTSTALTIDGCSCRMEDFTMALIKFSNDWINAADEADKNKFVPSVPGEVKPCSGCPDKGTGE